ARGRLCWQALQMPSLDEAIEITLQAAESSTYNSFQLLLADRERALVIGNEGGLSSAWLRPGLHVLTHRHGLDQWAPKQRVSAELIPGMAIDELKQMLGDVCRSHEQTGTPPFAPCVHDPMHGTRSSALVLVGEGPSAPVHFAFTEGAPCQTMPYREISFRLRACSAAPERTSNPQARYRP